MLIVDKIGRSRKGGTEQERTTASPFSTAHFPGTAIQCFTFLSQGASVAAGLSLGIEGISPGPIITRAVLLTCPVVWCLLVNMKCKSHRTIEVATGKMSKDEAHANDSPLLNEKENLYADGSSSARLLLLCGAVLPKDVAAQFGPLVGGLRLQFIWSPAVPALLPIVLFIASIVASLVSPCERVPFILGIVLACYATVVLVFRPFLALTHNAAEVMAALATATCLIIWSVVAKKEDPSTHLPIIFYILVALSNSRYPFVLARALDVVLPSVVTIRWNIETLKSQKEEEEERIVDRPLLIFERGSTTARGPKVPSHATDTVGEKASYSVDL